MFDDYRKSMTSNSWKYLLDNCVVYPDKNRFELDIADSLYVDLFIEKYKEMKEQNKRFVVIIEDTEAHWMGCKLHINLHKVLKEAKIPPQDILFITNDYHVEKHYSDWCKTMGIKEKINVIYFQSYLLRMLTMRGPKKGWSSKECTCANRELHTHECTDTYVRENEELSKKFICLMGRKTTSRDEMWNFYQENNFVKEQGHISYLDKDVILPNSWSHKDDKKRILNGESNLLTDNLVEYHQDCYFSIVAETNSGTMLSEKINKPLFYYHPFIVFSDVGIGYLKLLKKYGFETFPEWFDESYDEIEDNDVRFRFVQKEIKRLCNMSNEYLSELYKSVEDKLIHNKNNFLDFDLIFEREFIKDLTEILK